MRDKTVNTDRYLLLQSLKQGVFPGASRGDTDVKIKTDATVQALAAQIQRGESFITFEGNDEVRYPDAETAQSEATPSDPA